MRTTRADTYRSARIRSSEVFLEESSETQHDCPPLVDVSTSLISGGCSTPAPSVSSEKNAAPQAFSREGARKHAFSEVVSSAELILKPMEVESEPTPRTPFIGDISISPDWSPYLQISSPAFPLRSARARHLWHNSGTEQVTLQLPKVPYVSPRQSAPTSARSLAGNFRGMSPLSMYVHVCMCVCMCMREWVARLYHDTHPHVHIQQTCKSCQIHRHSWRRRKCTSMQTRLLQVCQIHRHSWRRRKRTSMQTRHLKLTVTGTRSSSPASTVCTCVYVRVCACVNG